MEKKFAIKPTDHTHKVAKETKRHNRLRSIKNELESGHIKSFDQIFAIISETQLSILLESPFYTFRKKHLDPREFTINDVMCMAPFLA